MPFTDLNGITAGLTLRNTIPAVPIAPPQRAEVSPTNQQTAPVNPREQEVINSYRSILGRDPDPEGLAYYLREGFNYNQLARAHRGSAEYRQRSADGTLPPGEARFAGNESYSANYSGAYPGVIGEPDAGSVDGGLSQRTTSTDELAANYPDFNQTPISNNPNDPSQTLADIIRREEERYNYFYTTVEDELADSLQDTSTVQSARETADTGFDGLRARQQRQNSRYGLTQTAVAQREFDRRADIGKTLNFDASVNDARLEQKERSDGLRRQLIDIGRGVAGTATEGLTSAANNQTQREANNANAKAQSRAQTTQTIGSLGALALAAFLI